MQAKHTQTTNTSGKRPWYKSIWLWFLLAFPIAAILGCIQMILVATHNNDGSVADDFSKMGDEVTRNAGRDEAAAKLGLTANLSVDASGQNVQIVLNKPVQGALQLQLLNPTRANLDQKLPLVVAGANHYSAVLTQKLAQPRWDVVVADTAGHWRLKGEIDLKTGNTATLIPGKN